MTSPRFHHLGLESAYTEAVHSPVISLTVNQLDSDLIDAAPEHGDTEIRCEIHPEMSFPKPSPVSTQHAVMCSLARGEEPSVTEECQARWVGNGVVCILREGERCSLDHQHPYRAGGPQSQDYTETRNFPRHPGERASWNQREILCSVRDPASKHKEQ